MRLPGYGSPSQCWRTMSIRVLVVFVISCYVVLNGFLFFVFFS